MRELKLPVVRLQAVVERCGVNSAEALRAAMAVRRLCYIRKLTLEEGKFVERRRCVEYPTFSGERTFVERERDWREWGGA